MFAISVDLRLLSNYCDSQKKQKRFDTNTEGARVENEYAEKTAECLMVCFRNLCTDTRSESQVIIIFHPLLTKVSRYLYWF